MKLRGIEALVVGMKRSGIASVELLAREGASVTATDLKPLDQLPEAREVLERLHIPFAVQSPEVFERAELIVLSPDVPADLAPLAGRASARRQSDRRNRTRRALPEGPQHRYHGIEREDDHDKPDRPHSARIRRSRASRRQHRNSRDCNDRKLARRWMERPRTIELPIGNDLRFPRAHRARV